MSIDDFLDKIKGKSGIDSSTFVCLCIIVLVGVSSFGLGRLSIISSEDRGGVIIKSDQILNLQKEEIKNIKELGNTNNNISTKERMYVASKNGKLYYSIGCSGAKRISPANELWFASSLEAEKAGYTLSSSCK